MEGCGTEAGSDAMGRSVRLRLLAAVRLSLPLGHTLTGRGLIDSRDTHTPLTKGKTVTIDHKHNSLLDCLTPAIAALNVLQEELAYLSDNVLDVPSQTAVWHDEVVAMTDRLSVMLHTTYHEGMQ